MQYLAKLILGGTYILADTIYTRDEEVSVTKEKYEYLSTLVEKKLQTKGNGVIVVEIPRFSFRFIEPTQEEKVLKEVETAPDTVGPKKPGRPAKTEE